MNLVGAPELFVDFRFQHLDGGTGKNFIGHDFKYPAYHGEFTSFLPAQFMLTWYCVSFVFRSVAWNKISMLFCHVIHYSHAILLVHLLVDNNCV